MDINNVSIDQLKEALLIYKELREQTNSIEKIERINDKEEWLLNTYFLNLLNMFDQMKGMDGLSYSDYLKGRWKVDFYKHESIKNDVETLKQFATNRQMISSIVKGDV